MKNHRLNIIYPSGPKTNGIPYGEYCYEHDSSLPQRFTEDGLPYQKLRYCKHWGFSENEHEQNYGYCSKLDIADWDDDGYGLLWDHCKCCGENLTKEEDLG